MYSASASAERVRERLSAERAFALVADVVEGRGKRDLAIALAANRLAVVRCSERATRSDHVTLETMVSQGDFAWAGLVYSHELAPDWPGRIEAFHIAELPRVIGRLKELQRADAP